MKHQHPALFVFAAAGIFTTLCSFVAVAQASAVVATVDGDPITAVELQQFVQPAALRIGADPLPDPRYQALEDAIRVRLFAREGKRRGLKAPEGRAAFVRAHLHQALIRAVLDERGISVDAVDDERAKAYFEAHRAEILKVASVQVRAVMVEDAALAERLLQAAAGIGAETFGHLVAKHSLEADSKKNGGLIDPFDHDHIEGVDKRFGAAVVGVAFGLRRAGQVGLAQNSNGQYYVLRAEQVQLDPSPWPWTNDLARRVKHLVVYEQREQVLKDLYKRLRADVRISIDERALSRIPITGTPNLA